MKKISLDLVDLKVASFDTAGDSSAAAGTVQGNAVTAICTPSNTNCSCYAGSCVDSCLVPRTGHYCYPC